MLMKCRKSEDARVGTIVIRKDGAIMMVNKRAIELFGYKPEEMYKKNVKLLMPEEHAVRHDGYLNRYLTTGEAKVIGTKGRNVMGKTKTGKMIPISLEVNEEIIDDVQIFIGSISDASLIAATVIINVKGSIQSCDENFVKLTGYDKDKLINQNIKMIMPYPYSAYHDSYLERYAETRQGVIVNDVNGRILQLQQADGSLLTVQLTVTSIENDNDILFKGVLVRTNANPVTDTQNEDAVISFNEKSFEILQVGEKIVYLTGHRSDNLVEHTVEKLLNKTRSRGKTCYGYLVSSTLEVIPVGILSLAKNVVSSERQSWRIFDLRQSEGVIRINKIGIVKEFGQGCTDLFGVSKSDILGRNITALMPESVAVHHLSFLERYQTTREARVVGKRRDVTACHGDGSLFPIALEVIEQTVAETSEPEYIGRVRHGILDIHVDSDWLQQFNVTIQLNTLKPDMSPSYSFNSSVKMDEKRVSIKETSDRGEDEEGVRLGASIDDFERHSQEPAESVEPEGENDKLSSNGGVASDDGKKAGGSDGGDSSHSSRASTVYQAKKILAIRNGTVAIPSIDIMNRSLSIVFLIMSTIIVTCIILVSFFPQATRYIEIKDHAEHATKSINDIISYARMRRFYENSSTNRGSCIWTTTGTFNSSHCPWAKSPSIQNSGSKMSDALETLNSEFAKVYSYYTTASSTNLNAFLLQNFVVHSYHYENQTQYSDILLPDFWSVIQSYAT
ncbi:hypothetical protein ROZALSC1DRAFT_25119, partial [Rozella allomycis CSF55]